MSEESKSTMDSVKDVINGSVESNKSSLSAVFKQQWTRKLTREQSTASSEVSTTRSTWNLAHSQRWSRHKFVDPLSNKTADRMQAVQDHANELAEVPGLSGETRQACAQNVREKLNEWGDSLDALQSHAAKEGGNVRTKVTSNVAKQRHQIDDVAKALEPDTKSS
ncbi:hypothetical protein Ae201684P_002135 [Aphanomyces euteiches]|nr:hypothetical protein Ae201684P_002135 [Aphanomyces euteiches]